MSKYEVTFDEYDAFCDDNGANKPNSVFWRDEEGWEKGNTPVINVSWNDAIAYCKWFSEKENLPKAYDDKGNLLDKNGKITTDPSKVAGYRLPTEAEWEYAAHGGNKGKGYKYAGSNAVDDVAWYDSNSGSRTQEVGKKAPNELGIYDMSGNVWEWCSDWWDSSYYSKSPTINPYNSTAGSSRVRRGGSWYGNARSVRVAYRNRRSPLARSSASVSVFVGQYPDYTLAFFMVLPQHICSRRAFLSSTCTRPSRRIFQSARRIHLCLSALLGRASELLCCRWPFPRPPLQ